MRNGIRKKEVICFVSKKSSINKIDHLNAHVLGKRWT